MMKKKRMLLLCVCAHGILFAQNGENKKATFQVSRISPLGANEMQFNSSMKYVCSGIYKTNKLN